MRKLAIVAAFVLTLGTASSVLATVVNVGGGTWNYGTSTNWLVGKNVWSHYLNNNYYHSATAIGGPNQVYASERSGVWAQADTNCMAWEGAAEYWQNYP